MIKKLLLILFFVLANRSEVFGQLSIVSNSYNFKNISNASPSEAGMDYMQEVVFSPEDIKISIAILPQNLENVIYNSWQVQVSKNEIDWDSQLELWIKRAGDGKSEYNLRPQSGTDFQKLESYNSIFFDGNGWINAIPIQLKITGLSVTLPAKMYTSEIVFTLIDN